MQYLFDEKGNRYLDMFAGIVTVSVGHCHPEVNAVMKEQIVRPVLCKLILNLLFHYIRIISGTQQQSIWIQRSESTQKHSSTPSQKILDWKVWKNKINNDK